MKKSKLTWTTIKRKPDDLRALKYNPRRLTEEQKAQLKASITKFGYVEIAAINTDNTIIAGHQRVGLLIELGLGNKPVDVRIPSRKLTAAEVREYNIRSNKNTGEWDEALLQENFEPAELKRYGFNATELTDLGFDIEPDAKPEKKEVAFTSNKHWRVIVECTGKNQQTKLYRRLAKEGYECQMK